MRNVTETSQFDPGPVASMNVRAWSRPLPGFGDARDTLQAMRSGSQVQFFPCAMFIVAADISKVRVDGRHERAFWPAVTD